MSHRSGRVVGQLALTLLVAASCAVFPDEAILPDHTGSAAAAGDENAPQAGHGGQGMVDVTPDAGRAGDATASGGTAGAGGTGLVAGAGVGGDNAAGAGGSAEVTCLNPQAQIALITDDTWIGSGKPGTGHANEPQLSVGAGSDEHRALMKLTLPAAPSVALLRSATLVLHLESNADAGAAARRLGVHELQQAFDASRATWINYGNGGNRHWTTPGGDFGVELGHANLPEGGQKDQATFDLTSFVNGIVGNAPIPLSLIVLETTPPPPAPAALAFTSVEGDTASRPQLILQYCDP